MNTAPQVPDGIRYVGGRNFGVRSFRTWFPQRLSLIPFGQHSREEAIGRVSTGKYGLVLSKMERIRYLTRSELCWYKSALGRLYVDYGGLIREQAIIPFQKSFQIPRFGR